MITSILIAGSVLLVLAGVFFGTLWGYRTGHREGRVAAEMMAQEHWVELLESSMNVTRSKAAHPSQGSSASST